MDWREVEGQILALDLGVSRYLAMNDSGRTLWRELAQGATAPELVEALVGYYNIERGRAEADVESFVSALDDRGLIVREGTD